LVANILIIIIINYIDYICFIEIFPLVFIRLYQK
jgi:hypothetical protein